MYEDNGSVGVRSTAELKKQMALAFSFILSNKRFKFHKYFQTMTNKMTPSLMKQEVIKQMKDYCIKVKRNPNDNFAPPTEIYTGKSGYGCDDIIITIQMNYIMYLKFISDKQNYQKYY
jgi:hypothetical protein